MAFVTLSFFYSAGIWMERVKVTSKWGLSNFKSSPGRNLDRNTHLSSENINIDLHFVHKGRIKWRMKMTSVGMDI